MAREHETSVQPWGTLEELLLACAVNRHGTEDWDFIAVELASRMNTGGGGGGGGGSVCLTPGNCKDRFDELKRRFVSRNDDESPSFVAMVDELKKIRVEELRREVRRRDVSIVSLELKVKRLEEERERSLKETEDDDSRKNLEKGERRLSSPENRAGKSNSGDDSDSCDRENRSYNESNSTTQKRDSRRYVVLKCEAEPEPERNELDPPRTESEPGKVVDGDENEATAREDNAKQSSDVQSSMSLSKNKRRSDGSGATGAAAAVSSSGEGPEGGDEVSPATKRVLALESEPLVKLLGTIRSHRLGSVFQRRLRSQESQRYKNLIRQHLDLHTIEARLEKGLYRNGFHKFFRDLLLLFTNAVVFFRKSSPEYAAANELRALVLKEKNAKLGKARLPFTPKLEKTDHSAQAPKPKKPSSIIVTCGKRSKPVSEGVVISKKGENNKDRAVVVAVEEKHEKKINNSSNTNNNSSSFVTIIDEKGIKKKRSHERVGRRNDEHEFGGNELSSHDALEISKKENAKKKLGAANFLKRMKQNSDNHNNHNNNNNNTDVSEDDVISSEEDEDSKVGKKEKTKKKMMMKKNGRNNNVKSDERQERVTRNSTRSKDEGRKTRRGVGRPPKKPEKASKTAATTTAAVTGGGNKRGRDNSEPDVGVGGRLKKRSRR